MSDTTFIKFDKARKEKDINKLRKLASETNDWNIILEYATLCYNLKKYDSAKEAFCKLLNTPKKEIAALRLGKIAVVQKDYDNARSYFEKVIGTTKEASAEYELGRLELSLGKVKAAKKHFLKVLKLKEDGFTLFELGKTATL